MAICLSREISRSFVAKKWSTHLAGLAEQKRVNATGRGEVRVSNENEVQVVTPHTNYGEVRLVHFKP